MPGTMVNIIAVRQIPSGDPARFGKVDTMVRYGVEGKGTDFLIIPDDRPTHDAIVAAVRAKVAGAHPSEGTSIEV